MRSLFAPLVGLAGFTALAAASAEAQVPVTPADTVWVQPTAYARSLAFSRDGAYVASGGKLGGPPSADGRIALWSAPDGNLVDEFVPLPGSQGDVLSYTNGLAFSGDGTHLVSSHGTIGCVPNGPCGTREAHLVRWAVPDLAVEVYRQFDALLPTAVQFSPDGTELVAGYANGEIRTHDQTTLASLELFNAGESSNVSVRYSPDGNLIASAGDETVVRLWDAATGELVRTLEHGTAPFFSEEAVSVAFSPDGQTLVTGTYRYDTEVLIWRVADGVLLRRFDTRIEPVDSYGARTLVEVSPNGAYVIAAVAQEYPTGGGNRLLATRLRVYDIETGALVADYDTGEFPNLGPGFGFSGLALSPGQDHQIAYSLLGSLTVVDTTPLSMAEPLVVAGTPAPAGATALRLTGPNPFRTATTLALDVAQPADVRVEAFDALGRRVAVLHAGPAAPGEPVSLRVNAAAWPSGAYTVRVSGAGAPLSVPLTVVR